MVKNLIFLKLLKMCLDIDLKMIFSKQYVPMPKTMYMRWKIRYICFLFLFHNEPRSNGVACGQYKDKEENTSKKNGPKNVKNENFEKLT